MSGDPTPGDPDEIRRLADHYQSIADEARVAAEILGQGGAVERGKGEAMDSLREKLKSLPEKLGQTRDSFEAAAAACKNYAIQLEEAQAQTDRAMDQALPVAATAARTVPEPPPDATDEQRDEARRQQDGIDAARQTMSAARSLAEQARNLREQAARRAGDELDDAAAKAIPERNIFQKIGDFFADFPLVKIILGILVAVTAVFFPVAGFALGATLFTLQTIQQLGSGEFALGDFLTGLVALVPGGALFRLGGRLATTIGTKIGPLFGGAQTAVRAGVGAAAGGGGFFQRVGGSLANIKNAFAGSRPVTVVFQSPAGRLATETAGEFARGVAEDAAAKALNGDEITPANVLAGAAAGAVTGGLIKGAREGTFGLPVKGRPPAVNNAVQGGTPAPTSSPAPIARTTTSDPAPTSDPVPATGPAPATGPVPSTGPAPATGPAPVTGPVPATGPTPAGGSVPVAGRTGRSQEFKENAVEQAAALIPEGVAAATKIGVAISEGTPPEEAIHGEASSFLAKAAGPVGKKGVSDAIDSFIPVKGTVPGGGSSTSTPTGQGTDGPPSGSPPQPTANTAAQNTAATTTQAPQPASTTTDPANNPPRSGSESQPESSTP